MGPYPHLWFLHAKQRLLDQNNESLRAQALISGFCMQNNNFGPELQVPMGPRSHLSFCAWKTVRFAPELQISVDPRPHLSLFCMQYSMASTRITILFRSQPSSVVFGCKTATFGQEQQVSMSPRHHMSFCACKTP